MTKRPQGGETLPQKTEPPRGKAHGDCECSEGMGGGLGLPKVPSEAPEGVGDVDRYGV